MEFRILSPLSDQHPPTNAPPPNANPPTPPNTPQQFDLLRNWKPEACGKIFSRLRRQSQMPRRVLVSADTWMSRPLVAATLVKVCRCFTAANSDSAGLKRTKVLQRFHQCPLVCPGAFCSIWTRAALFIMASNLQRCSDPLMQARSFKLGAQQWRHAIGKREPTGVFFVARERRRFGFKPLTRLPPTRRPTRC